MYARRNSSCLKIVATRAREGLVEIALTTLEQVNWERGDRPWSSSWLSHTAYLSTLDVTITPPRCLSRSPRVCGSLVPRERMADDIDWLSVLQIVFKKYGTQLHKNQVNQVVKFSRLWRRRLPCPLFDEYEVSWTRVFRSRSLLQRWPGSRVD